MIKIGKRQKKKKKKNDCEVGMNTFIDEDLRYQEFS